MKIFTVTFLNPNTNTQEISRFFQTKIAAVHWAKWLRTKNFCAVVIWKGQPGGERVTA